MLELAQSSWLFLLLAVAGWGWLAWRRAQGEAAGVVLNHPALPLTGVGRLPAPGLRWPVVLRGLAFALLALALAQPREVGDWITPPPEGRDMVLLIDTSLTMSIRDFKQGDLEVERMTVLKDTLTRFIDGRPGDRFGVIVFGSEVATLTPPTFDRAHVAAQIQRIQVGMVGGDTALGDALGMALKQVRTRRLRPAVILVSDGADNNAGTLTPAESLAVAHQAGVAIHALQFGSDPYAAARAARTVSSPPVADPQPDLADLARLTQGQYFAIASADDAARVIRAIDQLEPTLSRPAQQRQVREWYWAALALAAALLVCARWLTFRRAA
ncbi:VWA domain-containing protein [Thiobacillus denitrificans]|uniref:VWA domain-containing protein n=1 Tax=Thiobacillus denitrificans TaxID=36861 RepID=UPI000753CBC3|nr:VWA domain-containing protein [Thiobacillus denitrificans]